MVARRRRIDDPAALALVPDRTPAGDAAALARLNAILTETPGAAARVSGLTWNAEAAMLGMFGLEAQPGSLAITRTQLRQQRAGLLGERPSSLEKLIVGQLMRDWLWCVALDTKYALAMRSDLTAATGEFWGKQRERAHRQFTATAKTLAMIRAAQTPAVTMIVQP